MATDTSHWTMRAGTIEELGEEPGQLKSMWNALYVHQKENGMLVEVPANGFSLWAETMKAGFGRFSFFATAVSGKDCGGFIAGRIRSLPTYFGGTPVGLVSDVFVPEKLRGKGLGRLLLNYARDWFEEKAIHRLELQVFSKNGAARDFYRALGWQDELLQMVWQSKPRR